MNLTTHCECSVQHTSGAVKHRLVVSPFASIYFLLQTMSFMFPKRVIA